MTREEKVRKAISVLQDCADAAKGTEFADYYLMGADALRAQSDPFERQLKRYEVRKKEKPLTLDELRAMDGEPVWVQSPGIPEYGRWAIVEGVEANSLLLIDDFTCHEYGKTWLAYRRKPEDGTV